MFSLLLSFTASGLETVSGQYGETLEIPCKSSGVKEEDIRITKWKYVSDKEGQWIQPRANSCLTSTRHV